MKCDEISSANIRLDPIGIPDREVTTNADIIRNMSDEELAMFIGNLAKCESCDLQCSESTTTIDECCRKHLEWLQSEAE